MTATTLRAGLATAAVTSRTGLERAAAALTRRAPFSGPASARGQERAQLTGALPHWLRGDLVRVGPSLGTTPRWAPEHWFDGVGLTFGFELAADGVSLRWAALSGEVAEAAARGKVPLAQFASPNQRGPLQRLLQPIPNSTDNTNVNVLPMGDQLVALTETPKQHVLDPKTLQVRGRVAYRDELGPIGMLAHPVVSRGTITNLGMTLGRQAEVIVFDYPAASRVRRVRARWTTPELPYLHSFGLTERTAILIDHPLRVQPHRLLWTNRGFIDRFRWNPAHPARLIALDLETGRASAHETEALFCFHTAHAFETPEAIVLDLLAYDDAQVIQQLKLPVLVQHFPTLSSRLVRLSIDRRSGRVTRSVLCDVPFEFPQVDWEFVGHGAEQLVFGAAIRGEGPRTHGQVVRVDLTTGTTQTFAEPGYVFGEPLFVGKPGRAREGDGVLLATGSSERGAALFVLDATTLEVLARAQVSTHLPLALHGSFIPA